MVENLLAQLQLLSDKIHEEELSIIIEHAADVLSTDDQPKAAHKNMRTYTEREKTVSIFLRSKRIHLCLELIRQGYPSCIDTLRDDWSTVLDSLKVLEYEWDITNELLGDAVDIVLLFDPSKRDDLLRIFDFRTKLKIKKLTPLRFPLVNCAFQMCNYCLETMREDELYTIINNLISLSQERNAQDHKKHRILVVNALRYVVDNDRQLTCRICDASQEYFEGIEDNNACTFYWFYANSLLNANRSDEAIPLLKKCHELCMLVEGEKSWIGARSGTLFNYSRLVSENAKDAEDYLWETLRRIDENFYTETDNTVDFVSASTLSMLLDYKLNRQELKNYFNEVTHFFEYVCSREEELLNPNLTVRHAENLYAGYYMETGNYLQAVEHSIRALNAVPPNNIQKVPSDVLIYSNLLLIYTALNDVNQMVFYVQKLCDLEDEYEDDDYAYPRVSVLINTALKKLQVPDENLEEIRQELSSIHHDLADPQFAFASTISENINYSLLVLDMCSSVLDSGTATNDELTKYREIVNFFITHPAVYPLNEIQMSVVFTLLTQIEWQLNSPEALDYVKKSLYYSSKLPASQESRISNMRFAAVVYYNYQKYTEAKAVLDRVFNGITSAWQKSTAYLNDHRVCEALSFAQLHFNTGYSIIRRMENSSEVYERVLQFKDLPALVGRERNRILRLAAVDKTLKDEIYVLQNQLAAAELNDSLNGTSTVHSITSTLEKKEAQFAAQFPQNLHFTDISFERVCEKLPNNSAIIEYYFAPDAPTLSSLKQQENKLELDVFVTTKRNNSSQLNHLTFKGGDTIMDNATEYIKILLSPSDYSPARKVSLCANLYQSLIAPVLPLIDGISTIYLAPDDLLCNLPFEILHTGRSGMLQDKYSICRLVCGRDVLFFDDVESLSGGRSFILGDPNYEAERGEQSQSRTRGINDSLEPVSALPFSGIEAKRIAQRCRTDVYIGDSATKYALTSALPCRIIHLATHGVFDDQLEADSLYGSHLVFAGYNKWVRKHMESRGCGNGVLTADEISRMDLKGTELVVLSACQSGLGDTSYGTVRGLLSAFSAAGARWIVSHMWNAEDFTTPILMDAFYNAYLNKGMEVPEALRYAKKYLSTVTVGELIEKGWLDLPKDTIFSYEMRNAIYELRHWDRNETPFSDEYYWGGFTVHKSR